jgi:hypothetical protein
LVKSFLKMLRRRPALESLVARISATSTTWPADDFEEFTRTGRWVDRRPEFDAIPPAPTPDRPPLPVSIAPETFELRFTNLHAEGRLYEMWDMLAEDAQRAWGSRERFMSRMPRFEDGTTLLEVEVVDRTMLESWFDEVHRRTYSNVARLRMRYRIRSSGRETTFEQRVHLVPAAAGWRTLCYPASHDLTVGTAAGR